MEMAAPDPQERFQDFLKSDKYRQRISQMALAGSTSLVVDFEDLVTTDSAWAEALIEKPGEYLVYANQAALAQLKIEEPEYAEGVEAVSVRFRNLLETVPLRTLGSEQIGKLVMLEGIVVRSTPVTPMVVQAAFRCKRCGTVTPIQQTSPLIREPLTCSNPECGRKGPFDLVQEESTFIDSQEIRIQERPEDLPPGQLQRWLNVKIVGKDLMDVARPGDRVSIVGIVRAVPQTLPRGGRLRLFPVYLDANYVDVVSKEAEAILISPEEEKQILLTLASQAAIAIENARLFEETQRTYYETIKGLAQAL
ncbi:MAG: hypothetical protein QW231_05990, partial [Candidatus Bathyarchaeia archaeon]